MSTIDAEDLACSPAASRPSCPAPATRSATTAALFELGWGEVLAAAPAQAIATAFGALGATGSAAGILDDVLAHGLGLEAVGGRRRRPAGTARLTPRLAARATASRSTAWSPPGSGTPRAPCSPVEGEGGTELVRSTPQPSGPTWPRPGWTPTPPFRRVRLDLDRPRPARST
jgi:hypothetical protein